MPKVVKENKGKPSGKITYAERIELEEIEGQLEGLEDSKEKLTLQLNECGDDHEKLLKVGKELEDLINELDAKTERWMELTEKAEAS